MGYASQSGAIWARTSRQDSDYLIEYECSRCAIKYHSLEAECPLCSLSKEITRLRVELSTANNLIARQKQTLEKAHRLLGLESAMRAAIDLCGDEDLDFLIRVGQSWVNSKTSVILKVTHGSPKPGQRLAPANGFLAMYRGESESRLCDSIGGVALAGYFDEAVATMGHPGATAMLVKALGRLLKENDEPAGDRSA
jgi:hypothetical protein